jgi:hypothetical protein
LDDLIVLDLDNNSLTGSIPAEIGLLTNLQFLLLNRNELSSSIPSQLENMDQLRKFKCFLFMAYMYSLIGCISHTQNIIHFFLSFFVYQNFFY